MQYVTPGKVDPLARPVVATAPTTQCTTFTPAAGSSAPAPAPAALASRPRRARLDSPINPNRSR